MKERNGSDEVIRDRAALLIDEKIQDRSGSRADELMTHPKSENQTKPTQPNKS